MILLLLAAAILTNSSNTGTNFTNVLINWHPNRDIEIGNAATNIVIHTELKPLVTHSNGLYWLRFKQLYDKAPAWCKNAGELVPIVRGLSGVSAGRFLVDKDSVAQCRYMTNEELKLEEK
jgi:hypothetical protein